MPTTCLANFRSFSLVCVMTLVLTGSADAENWTRFRGDKGDGVSDQKGIPVTWSPGDYEWTVELPGVGHSSPVVYGDRLFVTSAVEEGALRYLFCLNANTGEQVWSTKVGSNRSHKHAKGSWASSTPATDGERVYVAFADEERYTLAAWDYEGHLVWRRNLGPFVSQHGQGVSPIVFDGMVIIPNDQRGPSSILALDANTGKTVWSTLRDIREASYSTPQIYQREGQKPQLICLSGAMGVTSLDPYTGEMNWMTGELPLRTVASPVIADGLILASCGQAGAGKLMIAVNPDADEDAGEPRIVYQRDRVLPYVPTSVVHEGHAYLWNDNGVVSCMELKTGKNIWTQRVAGNYSGSTVLIDGKIYIISEEGKCLVVAASPKFELLGENDLGDGSHSTPAVAGGRLYLRTFHRLAALKAEE
jgi:outer membrane protein assembly factor BamB